MIWVAPEPGSFEWLEWIRGHAQRGLDEGRLADVRNHVNQLIWQVERLQMENLEMRCRLTDQR